VISPQMMGKLLQGVRGQTASKPPAPPAAPSDMDKLSPREREILGFIARGQSNKEIARALEVAESTVKIHVQNLLRKLKLSSRVQAAVLAVEQGLGQINDAGA
jgi:two-component system nitrate/nitrite response regulator NarL